MRAGWAGHSLLVMQCSAGSSRFLRRPCSTERTAGRCTSCSTNRWDCKAGAGQGLAVGVGPARAQVSGGWANLGLLSAACALGQGCLAASWPPSAVPRLLSCLTSEHSGKGLALATQALAPGSTF